MKILLVNTRHFYGGGDSTYCFNLADLLKAQGHQVAFFAMQDERNLPDANADLFVSHIDFRELNRNKNPLAGAQVLGRVIYSGEARAKFSRLLERFPPDLVHLQNLHAHITPSVILEAKRRGLPVVWTLHDYKLICPNSHFLLDRTGAICEACGSNHFYQPIFTRCKKGSLLASAMAGVEAYAHLAMRIRAHVDFFLAPSQFLQNKLLDRGFLSRQVIHLPLFLPENKFQATTEDENYILFLGKLEPIKGIAGLLRAVRRVPQVKLVLVGRADESLAASLPELLPPNATHLGPVFGDDLLRLLRRARAIVLPSLWYENQPFSILEAFASSKPVIATNLGGMSELVKNQERGLLVPPGDEKALANAMLWMTTNPELSQQMGKHGFDYVRAVHSPEPHYRALVKLYSKLCQSRVAQYLESAPDQG